MASNWQCPSCGNFTTIVSSNETENLSGLNQQSKYGDVGLEIVSVSCPNPDCLELHVLVRIAKATYYHDSDLVQRVSDESIVRVNIYPEVNILPLPEVIPKEIKNTYREAKLVLPISGKASAALSRRCLQGIVRDFFKLPADKRGNLGAELNCVKDQIDSDVWDDIAAVRAVGDIGAHMDKNVDFIIDVHEKEASLLVELIEFLFKSWYIEREKKASRSSDLQALLQDKRKDQKEAKAAAKEAANSDTSEASAPQESPQNK